MNTQRILSAGIAVVVVVAVGLSASTLASSMSTDPADAVDLDRDALPLGDDAEGAVMGAAQGIHDQYSDEGDGQADARADGDRSETESAGESDETEQSADQSEGGDTSEQSARDDASEPTGSGLGLAPAAWPLWLLWLAAALAVVVALAYRYRDRLREALERDEDRPSTETLAPAPENEVERAWVELVERAGVSRPRTRTPRDCARLAVETGYDPAVVDRLCRAFEDVRYGAAPPTDEQARVARDTLAQLDGEAP